MSNRASAIMVLDSISPDGQRLRTFQLRYWRPIHSELMTHRVFSRNAGSSRARPSAKIIEQVRKEPWGPIHWGKNEPGMQANEELMGPARGQANKEWWRAAQDAAEAAEGLLHIGAHKQIVNRLLEPFTYIDVLVSATSYNNWYALRDHPDAQPEIRELAQLMKEAEDASEPRKLCSGEWHLPYITADDRRYTNNDLNLLRKISVARCARVSYKAFDGTVAPIGKDLELFDSLLVSQPLHASPAEHQATPDIYTKGTFDAGCWVDPQLHGNFTGWCQFRKMLANEFIPG